MFPRQSYSKDVAQSICYSPTKTRETRYFSEELSPISLLCTTLKTYRTLNPKPNQPYSWKILTSRARRVSQRALHGGPSCLSYTEHRTSVRWQKCLRRAICLDLTAAYDTVLHLGLHLKLLKVLTCQPMVDFVMELLYPRSFVLYTSDGQASRLFRTKNGVAQGSLLSPCLYNIYTADFAETSAKRCMYDDDVALTVSAPTFREAELALSNISLLLTLTWLSGNSGSQLRKLCAPSSTWRTIQPSISWMSK